MERFKVLVVDDERINIQVIAGALADQFDVLSAESGFEAISMVKEHQPDLILLDVMMPEMSGFETCQLIKAEPAFADIPVIFITALDRGQGEAQGLELGAVDYIMKPFDVGLVVLRVTNHLRLKHQRDLLASRNRELEEALARVKRLEGIISICMYCKQIRSEDQSWQQLERYISEHSDALFSHGICPHCFEKHFGMAPPADDGGKPAQTAG